MLCSVERRKVSSVDPDYRSRSSGDVDHIRLRGALSSTRYQIYRFPKEGFGRWPLTSHSATTRRENTHSSTELIDSFVFIGAIRASDSCRVTSGAASLFGCLCTFRERHRSILHSLNGVLEWFGTQSNKIICILYCSANRKSAPSRQDFPRSCREGTQGVPCPSDSPQGAKYSIQSFRRRCSASTAVPYSKSRLIERKNRKFQTKRSLSRRHFRLQSHGVEYTRSLPCVYIRWRLVWNCVAFLAFVRMSLFEKGISQRISRKEKQIPQKSCE